MSEETGSTQKLLNQPSARTGHGSLLPVVLSAFLLNACIGNTAPPPRTDLCKKPFDIILHPMPTATPNAGNGNSGNNGNNNNGSGGYHGFNSLWEWLQYLFGNHSGSGNNNNGNQNQNPKPPKAVPNRFVFDLSSIAGLLNNPNFIIESIDFDFDANGQLNGNDNENSLDINGIQLYGNGHGRHYELRKYDHQRNISSCRFHGYNMKLNGAEPIQVVMRRMLFRRGQFVVTVHSRSTQITNATLEVKGSTFGSCATPTPSPSPDPSESPTPVPSSTPTPTPVPTPTATPVPTPIPAPQTTLLSSDPSGQTVASTNMSFQFTSDQSGSNFFCSLDGAAASSCNSPQLYSNLTNGNHAFTVYAVNTEGTADPVGAHYNWTVNTIPPNVTLTSSWPSLTNRTDISLSFTSNDAVSYRCSIDAAAEIPCVSPVSFNDLGEGSHLVSVKAINSLGTISETAAVFQWVIDLTAPSAQLTNVEPATSFINTHSATFNFSASESSTFQCNIDSGGYSPCASPLVLGSLTEGTHSILIRATDLAGNLSVPATYTWTVDTIAPTLNLGQIIPSQAITNANMTAIEFNSNELVSYNCSVDGAAAVACTSPFVSNFATEGNHEVTIQAFDQAGNASSVAKVDWIMDFTLPILNFGTMLPSPASYINANYFQAEVIPSEQVVLSCSLNGYNVNAPVSPVNLTGLSEGVYHLDVGATDQAGNPSAPISHDFTVDLTAPTLTASASASGLTSSTMNTFTFSANESASFQCDLDGAGFGPCASPYTVSGFADGDHVFQVQAIDLAGNTSQAAVIGWEVATDTTAPIATGLTTSVTRNSVTVSWTTNEPATSKVNYGSSTATNLVTTEDMTLVTSHSVVVTGLNPNSVYTVMGGGQDQAGNTYTVIKKQIRTLP
jgi:hypothetical protein